MIRRAVTEGLRIWTSRPYFKDNPNEAIRRIASLKEDTSDYVRKSVGNALRDISKKFPELIEAELNNWNLESDEYTQRMSLSALSEIDYKKAEQYAIEFWERDKYKGDTYAEEYQKIMALSVLYKIKSDKLSEYIEAARQLDFVYLKENADEIANSGLIQ